MIDFGVYEGKCFYSIPHKYIVHDAGPYSGKTCSHSFDFTEGEFKEKYKAEIQKEQKRFDDFQPEIKKWNLFIEGKIKIGAPTMKIPCDPDMFRFLEISEEHREKYNLGLDVRGQFYLLKRSKSYGKMEIHIVKYL